MVSLGVVGPQPDGFGKLGHRFVRASHRGQHPSQVIVPVGILRPQFDHFPKLSQRFVGAALAEQKRPISGMRFHVVGLETERYPIFPLGLVGLPHAV